MAERLRFTVEDYSCAVARLMQSDGQAVGAGFLVAPSYVMTCAHVVLQALGRTYDEFQSHRDKPQETVKLDFPLATINSQPITARVVEWLPYSDNRDDIAVLKLDGDIPPDIRPIPFQAISFEQSPQDHFEVCGFPVHAGGWVRSYRPERPVDDGRLLLQKQDESEFDVIEGGYSGAPMWNTSQGCVVGMVATVQTQNARKAYAIGRTKLEDILRRIDAYSLYDTLEQSLSDCSQDDRYLYERAIATALERCNPNNNNPSRKERLIDLSCDRGLRPGWEETHPLTYFVVMLVLINETPEQARQTLQTWVECHESVAYEALVGRLTLEMQQRKVSPSSICRYLLVTVERVATSDTEIEVLLWQICDAATYSPSFVTQKTLTLPELPTFIQRECSERFSKKPIPVIHLFVPRDLLSCDVEMQPIGRLKERLGSTYPFVMRTNPAVHPIGVQYWEDWQEKWKQIRDASSTPTAEVFKAVDCCPLLDPDEEALFDLIDELSEHSAARLGNCISVEEILGLLADEKSCALPVAIWSRNPEFESDIPKVLDCVMDTLQDRIRKEREEARRSRKKMRLGHHLTLVWEDPNILPPNVSFSLESKRT